MNQREPSPRPSPARSRRRAKRRSADLPYSMLFLSVAAFVLAIGLLFDGRDKPDKISVPDSQTQADAQPLSTPSAQNQPPVQTQEEDPAAPSGRGIEPTIPPAEPAPAAEDWMLLLVNPWNPLPEDYTVTLAQLSNGHSVDERCYPDLQAMLDACRADGLSPLICSSYRSQEKQEALFQNKIDRLIAQGWSKEDAPAEAAKTVAVPGTGEHQLGLAVDIVDVNNQLLDSSQEDTAVQKWLMEHSWEYGFILRYPNGTSELTGIIYEPWHYRYVGKDAAKAIHELGVCLEEYLAQ